MIGDSGVIRANLESVVESLLFVAEGPVQLADIAKAVEADRAAVERAVEQLLERLSADGRGLRLQRGKGTVQMVTAPETGPAVRRYLGLERAAPLSAAALEALAMIAYRQPLTRPEIDELRGVNSDGVVRTLLARGLVEIVGRRDTVGLPLEYGTTHHFLEYFGLGGLTDLPPLGTDDAVAAGEVLQDPAAEPARD